MFILPLVLPSGTILDRKEVCYKSPETLRPKAQKVCPEPRWPPSSSPPPISVPLLHISSVPFSLELEWLSVSLSWKAKESMKTSRLPGLVPLPWKKHLAYLLTAGIVDKILASSVLFPSTIHLWLGYSRRTLDKETWTWPEEDTDEVCSWIWWSL